MSLDLLTYTPFLLASAALAFYLFSNWTLFIVFGVLFMSDGFGFRLPVLILWSFSDIRVSTFNQLCWLVSSHTFLLRSCLILRRPLVSSVTYHISNLSFSLSLCAFGSYSILYIALFVQSPSLLQVWHSLPYFHQCPALQVASLIDLSVFLNLVTGLN